MINEKNFPLKEAFSHRLPGSSEWTSYSTDQIITNSQKMAGGLLNLGLQKGDKKVLTFGLERVNRLGESVRYFLMMKNMNNHLL